MAFAFGKGQLFQVCVTPQNEDLTPVEFAALVYVDVCCLEDTPEMSSEANLISENCISGQKIRGVGADDDSEMTVSWYYKDDCVGQNNLRTFGLAKTGQAYAVKNVYANGVTGVSTPTTYYGRAIFSGFTKGGIGIDDVQVESVTASLVQGPVYVGPASV